MACQMPQIKFQGYERNIIQMDNEASEAFVFVAEFWNACVNIEKWANDILWFPKILNV